MNMYFASSLPPSDSRVVFSQPPPSSSSSSLFSQYVVVQCPSDIVTNYRMLLWLFRNNIWLRCGYTTMQEQD